MFELFRMFEISLIRGSRLFEISLIRDLAYSRSCSRSLHPYSFFLKILAYSRSRLFEISLIRDLAYSRSRLFEFILNVLNLGEILRGVQLSAKKQIRHSHVALFSFEFLT